MVYYICNYLTFRKVNIQCSKSVTKITTFGNWKCCLHSSATFRYFIYNTNNSTSPAESWEHRSAGRIPAPVWLLTTAAYVANE